MLIEQREKMQVLILSLCPALLVCTTFINAILMALVFLALLMLSTLTVSLCRNQLSPQHSLLGILLINASWAACLEMLAKVFFYELAMQLGFYLPLLAMNSFLLMALQSTALLNTPGTAVPCHLGQGLFAVAVICLTGLLRELLGQGTMLDGVEYVSFLNLTTVELSYPGLEVLQSPAAVFLLLGLGYPLIDRFSWLMNISRD